MSGGGKTSTSTSTATIPPDVLARYNSVNAVAQNVAQTPFQTYSSDPAAFVAPQNSTQQAGIANANKYAEAAQPWYSAAGQNLMQGQQAAMSYYDTAGSYYGNAAQTGAGLADASYGALQNANYAAQPMQNAAAYNISNAPNVAQPYYNAAGQSLSQGQYAGAGLGAASYESIMGAGNAAQPMNQAAAYNVSNAPNAAAPYFGSANQNLNQGLQTGAQLGQNSYNTLQGAQNVGAGLAGASYAGTQQALQTGAGLGQASYNSLQGANANASPYLQAAAGYSTAGGQAVDPTQLNSAAINQYMSPFLNNVYGATLAGQQQQNAQQMSSLQGTAAQAGAFGGDRAGIAAANMAYQQNLANSQTNANLLNTGYTNALNTAGQQQALGLSAGQANRAALQQASNQMLGLGQQQFNQGATTASQQAALGQQQYGQQANAAQQYAALGQQQFGQGATAAQQQAALGQQMFGQGATAAQQQASMGLGAAGLMSTAGQQQAALGQQYFNQNAAQAQQLAALGQQQFDQGATSAQQLAAMGQGQAGLMSTAGGQQAALGQQLYGQGAQNASQLAALGQQQFGQGQASGAAAQGLGAGIYNMGANTAQQLGALGAGAQAAGLQGAQAQQQAGLSTQQTDQAGLTALYNQFLQQQAYPFQTTQFLANIAEGTGALSGGSTSTTSPTGFLGRASGGRAQRYSGGVVNASMGGHVYPAHSGEGYAEGGSPAAAAAPAQAAPAQSAPVAAGLGGGSQGASSFFNTPMGASVGRSAGFQGFQGLQSASPSGFGGASPFAPPTQFPSASASWFGNSAGAPSMPHFPTASASGLGSSPAFSPQSIPQMQSFAPSQASMAKDFSFGNPASLRDPVNTTLAPWQQIIADDVAAAKAKADAANVGAGGAGVISGGYGGSETAGDSGEAAFDANAASTQAGRDFAAAGASDAGQEHGGGKAHGGRIHKAYAGAVSSATGPGNVDPLYLQAQMQMLQNNQNLPGAGLNLSGMPMSGAAAQPGVVPTTRNIMAGGVLPVSRSTLPSAPRPEAPQGLIGGVKELASDYRGLKDAYNTGSSALFGTKGTPAQGNTPAVDPSKGLFGNAGDSGGGYFQDYFAKSAARGGLIARHHYKDGGSNDRYPNSEDDAGYVPTHLDIPIEQAPKGSSLISPPPASGGSGGGMGKSLGSLLGGGAGSFFGPAGTFIGSGLGGILGGLFANGGHVGRHGYAAGGLPPFDVEFDKENAAWLAEHPPYDSAPTPPDMGERNFNPETELYANAPIARSDMAQNSLLHPATPRQVGPIKEERGMFPNLPPSGEGNVNYLEGPRPDPETQQGGAAATTDDQHLLDITMAYLRRLQLQDAQAQTGPQTGGLVAPVTGRQATAPAAPAAAPAAAVSNNAPRPIVAATEVGVRPVPVSADGTNQNSNYDPSDAWGRAMSGIESGGRYDLKGPITKNGDQGFGKYQVMGVNVGPWTKQTLGYALTPEEFLKDKDAQERVFRNIFGGYVDRHGLENAASMWHSGVTLDKAQDRQDILGTKTPDYVKRFMASLDQDGGASELNGQQGAPRLVAQSALSAVPAGASAPQAAGLAPAGLQAPGATAAGAGPYQQLQSQPLNWFQRNQDLLGALAGGVDKGAGALRWSQFIPRFAAGAAQGYKAGQADLQRLAYEEAQTQQLATQTAQIPINSSITQAHNLQVIARNAMYHTNDGTEWIMTEQGPMQTNIWKTMAEGQRPKPLGGSQAQEAISRIPGASPSAPIVNPLGDLNSPPVPSQSVQGQPTSGATMLGDAGKATAAQELKLGVVNNSYFPSLEKRQAAETAIRNNADSARATGNLVNQMASAVMKIPEGSWASGGVTGAARTQVVKLWNDLINALPGNDEAKKDYKFAESDLGNTAAVNKIATALAYANATAAGQQSAFALEAASKMVPTNLNTKNEAISIIPGLYVNKQRMIDQSKYLDDYKNFVASQNGGAFAGYYNPQSALTAHAKDFDDTHYLGEQAALKKLFASTGRDGTTMFEAVVQNAQSRPDLIEKMAATPGNPLYGMNAKNLLRYFTNN